MYQTNSGGRTVPTKKKKSTQQRQRGRLFPKLSEVERRFADEKANVVMIYARARQGRLETQQEVQETCAKLPEQTPPGSGVIVEEIAVAPQQGQKLPMASSEPSQPLNANLLARPSSPRAFSARPAEVGAAVSTVETPSAKGMKPGEKVLKRMEMVERRLVEVKVANGTYHHLDHVINVDFVKAWESEDAELIEEKVKDVSELEALWSDDPLSRSPPEPLPQVDRLVDEVEVDKLQEIGVIEKLALKDYELELLTTRWSMIGASKTERIKSALVRRRWMRRARLVAREYANHRGDNVHPPASGSQVLRLVPTVYLMLTAVDGIDQEEIQLGPSAPIG